MQHFEKLAKFKKNWSNLNSLDNFLRKKLKNWRKITQYSG